MERYFGVPPYCHAGGVGQNLHHFYAGGVENPAAETTTMGYDDAFLNGCFSELSFQSLLQPTPPSPELSSYTQFHDAVFSGGSHVHFQDLTSSSYGYMQQRMLPSPSTETPPPSPWNYAPSTGHHQDIKIPKRERFDSQEFAFQLLNVDSNTSGVPNEPLINFFATEGDVSRAAAVSGESGFTTGGSVDSPKRSVAFRTETPTYQAGYLSDIFTATKQQQGLTLESPSSTNYSAQKRYRWYSKARETSRQRQKKISEKIRRLGELLPSVRKMDMGTVLEEAYKYVKFLESQVQILQTLPLQTTIPPPPPPPPPPSNPNLDIIHRLLSHKY